MTWGNKMIHHHPRLSLLSSRVPLVLLGLVFCAPALAQWPPGKPVRVIFPATAGSLLDTVLRAVTQQVGDATGQSLIVENRAGAGTTIGMSACAKSAPDGSTVCTAVPDSLIYNPLLFTNLPYDPDKDFIPVTNIGLAPGLLAAHGDAPFKTMKEMIAYARANPGKINWGTWGAATIPEIYMNWVRHHTGAIITGIPYKGGGQAWPAMLAGETHVTFIGLGFAMPQIKAGKAIALAVTASRRSKSYPNIPSLAEEVPDSGLGDTWFGVFMPAGTSFAIVDQVHREFVRALRTPKVEQFMVARGMESVGDSPQDFAEFLKRERASAAQVFKTLGMKAGAGTF
ncbi:MAG: tripartite tricarboxylate transporter substrate binding protein [Betaproteobacteria bacterium]|nr:tripartite tricarboxylate transporter substrate binding protein [Betaproteobacteria bacterium]